jgi:hypothetical protein
MKSTTITLLLLSAVFATPKSFAQHPLDYLHGTWEGSGTTSGMVSSVRFTWGSALGGQFTTLQIHNRMTGENDQEYLFEGTGYYQQSPASNEQVLTGVWLDSQGDILPLHATLDERTLIAHWGSEGSKQGRSDYRLLPDGTLEAIDSIRDEGGEWREFGRSLLQRVK